MRPADSQLSLVARLALRDYWHEWVMSGCFVLALSAVLVPLLVLFGLKFGILSNLLAPLTEDPRYRQIQPVGSGKYDAGWFAAMAQREDVAFVIPRTRSIAATMRLRRPGSDVGRILDVELIPSATGDPVLSEDVGPSGYTRVVLSLDTADKLGADIHTQLEGIVSRTYEGNFETERFALEVVGVAPAIAFARDGLFVSSDLLVAIEDYRDGRSVPALGWPGGPAVTGERYFAGFRLYARELEDVVGLRSGLMAQGIDVRTRIADIELVQSMDRNLSIVFWIIALISAGGFCVSFGSTVWANVDRKRREFSILRLIGFRTRGIMWFPVLQALLTGVLGWGIAVMLFFVVQTALNLMFRDNVGGGAAVCQILWWHLSVALLLTLVAAALAAALGGFRVSMLEPSVALKEG